MRTLSHYLRPPARHAHWLYVVALFCAMSGAGLSWGAFQRYRIASYAQERNEKLVALLGANKVSTLGRAEKENLQYWKQLQIERDFPWVFVFRAVEQSASVDIELLEFKPDKLNRKISLSGEARNRKSLLIYLEQLSRQFALTNVYLMHQQTVQRDALETISFEINATLSVPQD